jgi:hypothetical protein
MGVLCSCSADNPNRNRGIRCPQRQITQHLQQHQHDHFTPQKHPKRNHIKPINHRVPTTDSETEALNIHDLEPLPTPAAALTTQSSPSHLARLHDELGEIRSASDTNSFGAASGARSLQHRTAAARNPFASQRLIPCGIDDDATSTLSARRSSSVATGGTLSLGFDAPLGTPCPSHPLRLLGVIHGKGGGGRSLLPSTVVDTTFMEAPKMISYSQHSQHVTSKTYERPQMVFDDSTSSQGEAAVPSLDGFVMSCGGIAHSGSFVTSSEPMPSPSHQQGGGRRSPSYVSSASRVPGGVFTVLPDPSNGSLKSDFTGAAGVGPRSNAASSVWSTGGGEAVPFNNNQIEPGPLGLAKFHTR